MVGSVEVCLHQTKPKCKWQQKGHLHPPGSLLGNKFYPPPRQLVKPEGT